MAVLCDTCGEVSWKYHCPACDHRSCSLQCCKRHKVESGCDGRRKKTSFVSLAEFTDNTLFSDYYFLEDIQRTVEGASRDHVRKLGWEHASCRSRFHRLRAAAQRRGVRLQLVTPSLSLHRLNTSKVIGPKGRDRTDKILWYVRLVFPESDAEYQEKGVLETTLLRTLLDKYIHPSTSDPIIRHRLKRYVDCGGCDGVRVFLRVEGVKEGGRFPLVLDGSLGANLQRRTIVEFPTLVVELNRPALVHGNVSQMIATDQVASTAICAADEIKTKPLSSLQLIAQEYS